MDFFHVTHANLFLSLQLWTRHSFFFHSDRRQIQVRQELSLGISSIRDNWVEMCWHKN